MNKLFVDTAGWLALVNRSDSLHAVATKIYDERFAAGWSFVTHAGVMLEVGNGLSRARLRHLAVKLKLRLDASARVEVNSLTDDLYEAGWRLYAKRPDKDWGVVDCVSFVLMEELGLTEALTTDHHFEQAGFVKLL
ncbi:MAG: type II toxin-antitoxin system VapC family toxin [Blastocatellia bacterium]